jgi:5-methylcytosine-specific restriction endonuclease McrA
LDIFEIASNHANILNYDAYSAIAGTQQRIVKLNTKGIAPLPCCGHRFASIGVLQCDYRQLVGVAAVELLSTAHRSLKKYTQLQRNPDILPLFVRRNLWRKPRHIATVCSSKFVAKTPKYRHSLFIEICGGNPDISPLFVHRNLWRKPRHIATVCSPKFVAVWRQ